jgi:two-component system, cell cycle sensor histidine kinase and response regulator CckA
MPDQTAVKTAKIRSDSQAKSDLGDLLVARKAGLVSQLAGSMSSQFNNIMMALTGCAELELKKATTPAQKRNIEQILSHSARATNLIQKLLTFGRTTSPSPRPFVVNSVVEEISTLLQPLAGEEIEVSLKLDPKVGAIFADPVEIEQLLLSLGLYARDAIRHRGSLAISTEIVTLDAASFGSDLEEAGQYVLLSLQYTSDVRISHGGDASAVPLDSHELRLMQTIASVRAIVNECRGYLRVASRSTQGTVFRIYFAALPVDAAKHHADAPSSKTALSRKTVLIVEDDDAVRDPAAEFLMMEGFKVLQARTGPEALRIVQESRSQLDLLVTDIVMPGMNGNEVADNLLKSHPSLSVLYMSGDSEKVSQINRTSTGARNAVLQKPFRLNILNEKIRELLSDGSVE